MSERYGMQRGIRPEGCTCTLLQDMQFGSPPQEAEWEQAPDCPLHGHGFAFSCDSPDGCLAHAMVAGDDLPTARDTLCDVLEWTQGENGGVLCPEHVGQEPVAPREEGKQHE